MSLLATHHNDALLSDTTACTADKLMFNVLYQHVWWTGRVAAGA